MPKTEEEILEMNYDFLCEVNSNIHLINAAAFKTMMKEDDSLLIDVREENELPEINFQESCY